MGCDFESPLFWRARGGSEGWNGVSEYLLKKDAASKTAELIYDRDLSSGIPGKMSLRSQMWRALREKKGCLAKRDRESPNAEESVSLTDLTFFWILLRVVF